MGTYMSFNYWLFDPNFWLIIGVLLIIADIFLASFFLLPIGISALCMAALIYFDTAHIWEKEIFTTWHNVLLWFAVLSVATIFIIQMIMKIRREKQKDINQY